MRINEIAFKGGEYAITDVYQAQLLVQQAEASVITLDQSIEQTENALSILLGRNPGPILRGQAITDEPHMAEVPAGLPSAILERRPDVLSSGRKPGCCQCEYRSREGGLLPANSADSDFRSEQYRINQLPAGTCDVLDDWG